MSLNELYNFDYEFMFDNNDIIDMGRFDIIYNKCNIEDVSGNRKDIIYNKCVEIMTLLSISPGFRVFSSFINYENKKYKVTIFNIEWNGSGLFQ
jgi:hypothetical protein